MSNYELDGVHYRDDRMYVFYLCKCTEEIQEDYISTTVYHENAPQDAKWCLVTYRNVERYMASRSDVFETRQEAEQYMKHFEPATPLVSLGGHPQKPLLEYNDYVEWKSDQGFEEYDYKLMYSQGITNRRECILRKREIDIVPQEQNHEEMSALFMKAELGNPDSQFVLGLKYMKGDVVPLDIAEAFKWILRSAKAGFVEAQLRMGHFFNTQSFYENNLEGISTDDVEASKWYQLAADQSCGEAQFYLAMMFRAGRGVPQDNGLAVKWHGLSRENGFGYDLREYDEVYLSTPGPEMYMEEAKGGDMWAQEALGDMYYSGKGVERDLEEAVKWYLLAAEQGLKRSAFMLGIIYAKKKEDVIGYAWLHFASLTKYLLPMEDNSGIRDLLENDSILLRDKMGKRMSDDQLKEAQSLSESLQMKIHNSSA
jgi:TPR repeat protein